MKQPKSEPVVEIPCEFCSLCGERWIDHGGDPTTLDCIRLLLAKSRKVQWRD